MAGAPVHGTRCHGWAGQLLATARRTAAAAAAFTLVAAGGGTVPEVPLQDYAVGDFKVLLGRETAVTSQPFYVLREQVSLSLVQSALDATMALEMDDHNDEADWQPAFEVYFMEGGHPVPGLSSQPLLEAVAELERRLMPFVRQAYRCPSCVICTGFVRRYLPNERLFIPAHFDVTSYATVVMPLSRAENYSGGFFVQPTPHVESRVFVPLEVGDISVYDFTLSHGVQILDGGRYILVVWVSETQEACRGSRTPWHAQRALNGDLVAQHILGMMYSQGNGAPKDDVLGLDWTLKAAEGGLANAQFSAGTMYIEGQGAPANETRALYWYGKAAEQGDASAQMLLARMYADGLGTVRDPARADFWYRLGASQQQHGVSMMGPPRWAG